MKILAKELKKKIDEIEYPSERPPITPLPIGVFAAGEEDEEEG